MVYTLTVHLYANDKPESIELLKQKLIEAAKVYRKYHKNGFSKRDSLLRPNTSTNHHHCYQLG